jgi:hypothetical protein
MLPAGLLMEQYYVVIARAWYHAGPWLTNERKSVPRLYEDFVCMAQDAQAKCSAEGINVAQWAHQEIPPGAEGTDSAPVRTL